VTHRAVRLIAAAAAAVCLQAAGARDNNLQILQTRDHVLLISEMIHDARVVPLDGRPHAPASVRTWTVQLRWPGRAARSTSTPVTKVTTACRTS